MAMTLVALVLAAALNPLVVRSPEPQGNVPANCEVSDAPPAPRAAARAAAVDDPGVPLPPVRPAPRTEPRYDVGALRQAIAANDRTRFDAELARARDAGVPTRVYEDVGRLWDAQFESPFFAEGSEAHGIASQYPGYEAAVREQIFTDASGRKFYPASESKAFVARQTGVNLPAATARPRTSSTTQQPRNRVTQPSTTPSTTRPSETATTTRKSTTSRAPATRTQTAVARKESAQPRRSPDPSAAQKRAATVPAPVVPPVEHTSSTKAPPAAGSLPVEPIAITTAGDPPFTDTAATDTTATDTAATDTTVTETTTTAADTATTAPTTTTTTGTAAQPGRSIVLPAILILIGLGVLILLFRAK